MNTKIRYDLDSLELANGDFGYPITEKEVRKVNRMLELMENVRNRQMCPTEGDCVEFVSRSGDYFGKAHIDFGYAWTAEAQCFPTRNFSEDSTANIIITCTDNIRSRLTLWKFLKKVRKENFSDHSAPIYWMDFGNSQTKGQVIIGTVREKVLQPSSQEYIPMPKMNVITEEVDYAKIKEKESGPSCSLAEALEKQDLFINSTLAHIGCDLLWKMFKEGKTLYRGVYVNLDTLKMTAIPV